jgi:peptide/nickel transport system substrate-binding protein
VRQAIAYAVDKDFILNAIQLGTAQEARTGIHPGSPFYEPDVEPYELDIDKANQLLDEAGYEKGSDGMRFQLGIDYGSEATKPLAEYLKPQLKKIGIDVEVRPSPDFPTWAQRMATHEFDMSWDTVFNWGDPVIGVHRTYVCDNIKEQVWSNTQSYCNEKVDELLAQAGVETDPEKRTQLYSEFQKIVAEELPLYPVYAVPYHTISNAKVGNPPAGIWATVQPLDRVYLKP